MRTRTVALVMLLGFLSQACYTYTPIEVADLTPGMEVRTEVTPAERDALAESLPGDDRTLDGTVVDNGTTSVMLQVEAVRQQRGTRIETLEQRVAVDKAGILEVQVKERDQARTAGLIAVITAGVLAVVVLALQAGNPPENPQGPPDGPQDNLIPLLKIPLGR